MRHRDHAVARNHPLVLKPEPSLFVKFRPHRAGVRIRTFLADILNGSGVQNDIRFAILDAFALFRHQSLRGARRSSAAKPNPWPTDDDKTEESCIAGRRHGRSRAAARRPPRRQRKPDRPERLPHSRCGMNVAFSCGSPSFAL